MSFSFNWKFKDYEIQTRTAKHPYVELVKWDQDGNGRAYCFTLAYWYRDKDGNRELHFVCDRPFEYVANIDIGEIWKQLWLAQQMLEDAEQKLGDN